jgi:light-regulated signal transduction histidine kinase (bacteriophytochrome)
VPKAHATIEDGNTGIDDEIVYDVKDNGVGFDMAYADKLFSPFHRLHRIGEVRGFGIGLAKVQRIVYRHGARIRAQAAEGAGANFYFTL